MPEKRWIVRHTDPHEAGELANDLQITPVLAALLLARGYSDRRSALNYLNPSEGSFHNPNRMLGMERAVARVLSAIDRREPILIYGDYDVDGTMGTVVLRRALGMLGAVTSFHIPHRFTEGYGLQIPALQKAAADGIRLVISVDCGIRAYEPLHWARSHGLDVIVTDHHLPDEKQGPPPAYAILNPNQPGCEYPDKNLAGVGVAWKLSHALFEARNRGSVVKGFLKIVAIGTVADVAPLVGENRAIVALGLADLVNARNRGLRALIDVAGCGGRAMSAYDVGFRIGPRINAAGRMEAGRAVVELFEAKDGESAVGLAAHLDERNCERRTVQEQIFTSAVESLEKSQNAERFPYVAVVAEEGWHRGVIGIAASKLAERLNRPCVVISLDGEIGHGSGRSIEAYHLLDGLTACSDLFEAFGGHSHAAGISIRKSRIDELRRRLNDHAATRLAPEDMKPLTHIDVDLPVESLTLELAEEMQKMEPFGACNKRPVFVTRGLNILGEPRVLKDRHLKMFLGNGRYNGLEALWWGGVESNVSPKLKPGDRLDVVYTLEANCWSGRKRLQLCIEDVKPSSQDGGTMSG